MMLNEKLDKILTLLVAAKNDNKDISQPNSGYSFDVLCDLLSIPRDGEDKLLKSILIEDGHIEYPNKLFNYVVNITTKGLVLINNGGYTELEAEKTKQKIKKELEIMSLKSSISVAKWNKFMIVLSLTMSVVAILLSIFL